MTDFTPWHLKQRWFCYFVFCWFYFSRVKVCFFFFFSAVWRCVKSTNTRWGQWSGWKPTRYELYERKSRESKAEILQFLTSSTFLQMCWCVFKSSFLITALCAYVFVTKMIIFCFPGTYLAYYQVIAGCIKHISFLNSWYHYSFSRK